MLLRYLLGSLLAGQALADLICADYTPLNWTSPLARVYSFVTNAKFDVSIPVLNETVCFADLPLQSPSELPPTLPAFFAGTNPLHLAANGSLGGLFRLKTCNSTSLNLSPRYGIDSKCQPPYPSYCRERPYQNEDPRRNSRRADESMVCNYCCEEVYQDNLQIIHNATGHCLTWYRLKVTSTPTYGYKFMPCNPDPRDTRQIWQSQREIYHYTDWKGQMYGVCDWDPSVELYPYLPDDGAFDKQLYVDSDNKTIIAYSLPNPLLGLFVVADHHDPLTSH